MTKVLHLHGEATKVRPEDGEYDRTYSEEEVIDIGYDEVHFGPLLPLNVLSPLSALTPAPVRTAIFFFAEFIYSSSFERLRAAATAYS